MGEYEKQIVDLYESCPSRHQIKALAGMYNVDVEEVERILTDHGRTLPPKAGRPKATIKKSDPNLDPLENEKVSVDADSETEGVKISEKVIPEAVKDCITKRIDEIDAQIDALCVQIEELAAQKTKLNQEYKVLADFIMA